MTVLVTGARGQLGRAVAAEAGRRGNVVVAVDLDELPIDDPDLVRAEIERLDPRLVVNCAAWTDVDACEGDPERADLVNGSAVGFLVSACRDVGAAFAHVSTDYVFAGDADEPYVEDDPPDPRSAYGRSKLLGERAVLGANLPRSWVVRTAWVFGPGGNNFPAAILKRARSGQPLRVVDDQQGCPTMTLDLADVLLDLPALDAPPGLYHATNDGRCTWHEFAVEICRRAGLDVEIGTMSTAELDRPAPRPAWSVLDCSRLAGVRGRRLPHWTEALDRYLVEESS